MKIKNIIKFILILTIPIFSICSINAKNLISSTELNKGLFFWERENIEDRKKTYFIFSDASKWDKIEDFYKEVEYKFHIPSELKILNVQCYLDRMRNLYWFKYKKIAWLIKDLSKFTKSDNQLDRNFIVESFKEYILPFWEGVPETHSVVDCFPGVKPKQFNVYYT